MYTLTNSLQYWKSDDFPGILKHEVEHLPAGALPLYQCTTQGGMVDDSNITVTILRVTESEQSIQVLLGEFFDEVVGGCNCHDDPVVANAYGEILLCLDRISGDASFMVHKDKL